MTDDPKPIAQVALRLASLQNPDYRGKTDEEVQKIARDAHEDLERARLAQVMRGWGLSRLEAETALRFDRSTTAAQRVEQFIRMAQSLILVLNGGVGAGKSCAAAWWLTQVAKDHLESNYLGKSWRWCPRARFVKASWLGRWASSFDRGDRREVEAVSEAPWLVLDDLGIELESASQRQAIEVLIDERNSAMLKTVITTNLSPEAMLARYGARVDSRLRQFGGYAGCGDVDLRRRKT